MVYTWIHLKNHSTFNINKKTICQNNVHNLQHKTSSTIFQKLVRQAIAQYDFSIIYISNLIVSFQVNYVLILEETMSGLRTSFKGMVSSEYLLQKTGLRNLNEMVASQTAIMVWKSHKWRGTLDSSSLFLNRKEISPARSINIYLILGGNNVRPNFVSSLMISKV